VASNGNVGIGTASPAATLEVNGNAQVDGGSMLASGSVPVIQFPNNGSNNFSAGLGALPPGTTGTSNTAVGDGALQSDTTGYNNTAVGAQALANSSTAKLNTAIGYEALQGGSPASANTGGTNTASGAYALLNNTTGINNTASGAGALQSNTIGKYNTAVGVDALVDNIAGTNNIAVGIQAGQQVTGDYNIDIGSFGTSSDNGVVRIGTPGNQISFFVAGVTGVTTGDSNAIPVLIDANGQLGTVSSSRRFKKDIQDMGDTSSGLLRLRPVTFRYKRPFSDGSQPIQYGLVAEEVAEVYPDLVARSADGQIETVKYQVLDSMLLNELQKQNTTIMAQKEQIRDQGQQIRALQERLSKLEAEHEGTAATGHPTNAPCAALFSREAQSGTPGRSRRVSGAF